MMALSLAACGGSSTTTTTTTTTTDTTTDTTTAANAIPFVNAGTTSLDTLTGTSGVDNFTAAAGRMDDGDVVNGVSGADTLTATIDGSADAYISNVPTVSITALGANASMNGVRLQDVTNFNVDGGGTLTLTGAAAGIVYNVSGAGTALTMTQAGTDSTTDAVTVGLGAGALGTVTVGTAAGSGAVDFETINLVIGGAGSATITEAGTPAFDATGDSIVVTGSGDYELNIDDVVVGAATNTNGVATTINAAEHTGALTLDLGVLDSTALENNASNWTGVDVIKAGLSGSNQIENIQAGTSVELVSVANAGASGDDLAITAKGTGTADNVKVSFNTATAGTSIFMDVLTTTGIENVELHSTGADIPATATAAATVIANTVDALTTTTIDTTLTISGDKKLTVNAVDAQVDTIVITNTTGSDVTVAAGGDLTYTGGAGVDRLELDTMADITSADTLAGGDGKDTLALSQTIGTDFSTAQLAAFSGFEVLEYVGASDTTGSNDNQTIDLTKITGVNELTVTGTLTTDSNDLLIVKAADGFTANLGVTAGAAAEVDFQITGAATAGTANTVNVNLANTGSGVTNVGFTVDNVETVNLNVAGDFTSSDKYTLSDIDGAVLQTLNIASTNTGLASDGTATASDDLTITTIESTLLTTLNAGSFTGALDVSGLAAAYAATGATITGGSGADIIYAGTGADTINAGGGADTIRGGTGADVINSGAGDDTVLAATGQDSTPELRAATIGGTFTTADVYTTTIFGKTFTVTYGDVINSVTIDGTLSKINTGMKFLIDSDADMANLVTTALSTSSATSDVLTITSIVDGDFVDFTGTMSSTGTISLATAVDGTNSTDVDVVDLGAGADFVHTSGGIDTIDLGAADGAADTVYILNLTEGADVISNFEAGSIGSDVIKFAGDLLNNGSSEASTLVSIANTGATADNRVFFEITTATAAGAADTAAEIVTHLTGVTLTSIASGDDVVFAVNDGTDTYLWQFTEDGSAGIQADDLTLVGELAGVTDIVNGDLGQIA